MVDLSIAGGEDPAPQQWQGDRLRPLREHRGFIAVFVLSAVFRRLC
jgi:hypothetical protein